MSLRNREVCRMRTEFSVKLRKHEAEELTKVVWKQNEPSVVKMKYFDDSRENSPEGKSGEGSNQAQPVVKPLRQRMVPRGEYFQYLLNLHLATNHGGYREMCDNMNRADYVPMSVIKLFPELCKQCQMTGAIAGPTKPSAVAGASSAAGALAAEGASSATGALAAEGASSAAGAQAAAEGPATAAGPAAKASQK